MTGLAQKTVAPQLYSVTLHWEQADAGNYTATVTASDIPEACMLTARKMSEEDHLVFDDQSERETWIWARAQDVVHCALVADILKGHLAELFAAELYPDGVEFDIDVEALRALVLANRDQLRVKPAAVKTPLTFKMVDEGNCRVYYTTPSKHLVCFQLYTRNEFELFYCSRDGEPEHTIPHTNKTVVDFPDTNTGIAGEFITWWNQVSAA